MLHMDAKSLMGSLNKDWSNYQKNQEVQYETEKINMFSLNEETTVEKSTTEKDDTTSSRKGRFIRHHR